MVDGAPAQRPSAPTLELVATEAGVSRGTAHGYDKRFGIVHVDYGTQVRTLKDSAYWYAGVIRENGLTVEGPSALPLSRQP